MAQAMLNVRISTEDKSRFEEFCSQTGLNISTCINMFVKAVLREQKLPFEVKAYPLYVKKNQDESQNRIETANADTDASECAPIAESAIK